MTTATATTTELYAFDDTPRGIAGEIVRCVADSLPFTVRASRNEAHRWIVAFDPSSIDIEEGDDGFSANWAEDSRSIYEGMICAARRRQVPGWALEDSPNEGEAWRKSQFRAGYAESLRLL